VLPFILLKLLAFIPGGNLLKGTSGKLILIGLAVAAVAFFAWRFIEGIKEDALNEVFAKQATQLIEQQQKQFDLRNKVRDKGDQIQTEVIQDRQTLILEIERLRNDVRGSKPEDDGEVAPVLANVIEHLRRMQEVQKPAEESTLDKTARKLGETAKDLQETGNSAIDKWKKGLSR
jgi:hypothetical protein